MRVLVIDTDHAKCDSIGAYLRRREHVVEHAHTAFRAIHVLQERDYDVMLLNGRMPGLTAPEMLRILQDAHPPVIGLDCGDETLCAICSGGCLAVLCEPYDLEFLANTIERIEPIPNQLGRN